MYVLLRFSPNLSSIIQVPDMTWEVVGQVYIAGVISQRMTKGEIHVNNITYKMSAGRGAMIAFFSHRINRIGQRIGIQASPSPNPIWMKNRQSFTALFQGSHSEAWASYWAPLHLFIHQWFRLTLFTIFSISIYKYPLVAKTSTNSGLGSESPPPFLVIYSSSNWASSHLHRSQWLYLARFYYYYTDSVIFSSCFFCVCL